MNREIKFRAWLGDFIKEMDYENVLGTGYHKLNDVFNGNIKTQAGITPIWIQYIGLKDRNGKEGYYEDIVKFSKPYSNGYGKPIIKTYIGIIKENYLSHSCIMVDDKEFNIDNLLYGEIIGNRFENPELLK